MTKIDSLAARFRALQEERERDWPAQQLRANIEQRRALVAGFDRDRAVKAGDVVPPFSLEGEDGADLELTTLIAEGPALLLFFRFAGCPACNIALAYYDQHLRPALDARGVTLIAISPHAPEKGLGAIKAQQNLGFPVACDRGNTVARGFGLAFLPAGDPRPLTDDPNWIGALTGLGTFELPMPAAVLIDQNRVVRYAAISPDWLDRPEADPIIEAASRIRAPISV